MENHFNIVRMSNEQVDLLIPLYKAAFNRTYSKEYLLKKYDTSMFGKPNWGYLALNRKGETVAFYSNFANSMLVNGKKTIVA